MNICGTCATDLKRNEAKVSKSGICTSDLMRISLYAMFVQRISNDIEMKIIKFCTCAADLLRMSQYAVPVQQMDGKCSGFSAKVSICNTCAAELK